MYTVSMLKKCHLQNLLIPNPEYYGWKTVDGVLLPHWFDGEELQLQLKDVEVINESDSEDEVRDIEDDISIIESDIIFDCEDE